jgi:hypothetical protein
MNTLLPGRMSWLLLISIALAGTTVIQSAQTPVLTIERSGDNAVLLSWTNGGPGYVLQEMNHLGRTDRWQSVPLPPQPVEGWLGVTVSIETNETRLFRLKARGVEFTNHQAFICWQDGAAFDAGILLSAESITDPAQLNWILSSNSVGAVISPAGLVSLGSAPGAFLVTAATTNGSSEDSFTLQTIQFEFTSTQSVLCWQPNDSFDARTLLSPGSTTNEDLVQWRLWGSGPASISDSGIVSLGSGGGAYVVMAAARSNTACAASFGLEVHKLEFETNRVSACWQTNGTFDAKAFLTPGSITNDSLLEWVIAGTGPASVDSMGVVNLGAGPGGYVIQVSSRSNAACTAALDLEVIKLELSTNAATVCWQSNGTFDAKALLTLDSLTNDSSLVWTISGSGPARIDEKGLVDFGSTAGSYLVQVSDWSNTVCMPYLALDIVKLEFTTGAAAACWQSNGLFNAKALLSAESTTDDSLLTWTILGSGPATIDTAGLVSLGNGPGRYRIQVSGRSNDVCAAGLALEVTKLELAANAATVCWQPNGVFDAKALLSSDSLTNDDLLMWTINGDGPATIDGAGVVSFGPTPGSYVVHVSDRSNPVCAKALGLDVVRLEFITNAATVCWQADGIFDARSLLATGSTTNDALLVWTIVGTGPASIDGAGLVSFGAEPGSYTIQVSGRSNMTCAATLNLDMLALTFATNAATVCWQTNGTFNARTLLTPNSTTNDSLVDWTISGSGPATIDSAGLVSFGAGPGSYAVQASGRSNGLCGVSLALDVLTLSFATNIATVCWQPDGSFSAKTLLTTNSTTNDSLVAWTMVGSGPAVIDSTGLVNLGIGPGTYTIQVSGRSDVTCAATLNLDVLRVELITNAETVCWQTNGTFNAKALLTSNSTTNDSLLAWTVSGSPPAAIDSSGVFHFGAGPGDYTVQVGDGSNSVCGASFNLKVLKLEFAVSETTICWQSNGTFNARALLTTDSTTNDSLLAWAIAGSGPATIDGAGVISVGAAGGSYGVQVAARSNAACSASFLLKIIRLEFATNQAATCWQSNGVFNAKALLTTNSTTDNSLAQWSISGSPPGSVDGAGMVALGSGAGNYVVQVAPRSNATCPATLALNVTKVDFVKNQAYMAWQTNGTFNARALLASDGLTNAASLNWSIAGSPSATISTSGVVTLGAGGGSYMIQATAKGTLPCSDTLTLNAVEARLKSISFISAGAGNGGTNLSVLYMNADPQNWGDGRVITNPVWIAGTNNQPARNYPACYNCSGATNSKVKAQVAVDVKPASQTFNFIGLDQSTEYFRTNGILSTGADQVIDVIASVPLTNTVQKLLKTFTWQAVFPDGISNVICGAGQSTNTIYTIYSNAITYVEGQTNNPTPYRLDFCIVGVAAGLSDKVAICSNIAAAVRAMTGDSYGNMVENPRWDFYAEASPRDLDCHHRAALAASGFGVLGIQGYVHRTYSTCYPVPPPPQYYPSNTTVNDYMGTYTTARMKYRQDTNAIRQLAFLGPNNFEGCVRVEDGSSDDGNTWWTIWPLEQHQNAKALIIWYTGIYGCTEQWQEYMTGKRVSDETVPVGQLADKVKIIGGPD